MDVIEGRDIFIDDFLKQDDLVKESNLQTEIQQFFNETSVFITGATGFLGRILLEKILRTCRGTKTIYLLTRPKKGKLIEERLEEIFQEPLFGPLKKEYPNFREKITVIPGDLSKGVGIIADEDKETLIKNVGIVFHCAATVRFDEKLRSAANINLKATKELLEMGREMKNLKAFLYVSTAYSNCPLKEIGEKFYTPPFNYKNITSLIDAVDDTLLERITPELIGQWPNTYTFTKTIAEDLVKDYGKELPIGILRPSIVVSTFKEPLSGWINNYYGPQGVVFGTAQGLLRTLHCDPDVLADMVPVDMVINVLIALAWDIGQTKGDNPNVEKILLNEDNIDDNSNVKKTENSDEVPILNYVSSERNPITWGQFMDYNYKAGQNSTSQLQLWYSSLTLNKYENVDFIYKLVCHYFPAVLVDSYLYLCGRKPILINGYKKIDKFTKLISYFSTNQWKFGEENAIKLWKKMSPRDQEIFPFCMESLEWSAYFDLYVRGMQVYLAKDNVFLSEKNKGRRNYLRILHYSLVFCINLVLFSFLWWIYSLLFG